MPKRLSVSIDIALPDDPFAAADVYKALQPSWASMLEALKAGGAEHNVKFQELEVRAKRIRPPRKPRLVAPVAV
jgi:hypothetical protein